MSTIKRLGCVTIVLFYPLLTFAYPPPTDPLVRIHYDFEVAGYCNLITREVSDGFQFQLKILLAKINPDQDSLNNARGKAWQAAHEEWQNRGLGGYKAWCRNEGVESANRFTDD